MIEFKGSHFGGGGVLWGVRWYVAYPISYRQLEEMMQERGVEVDHSTLNRWVLKYVPLLDQQFRARKRPVGYRGRDAHYWAPPAQIRTSGLPAYGSYLGCLTAKRMFGQGCRIRGLGSHSSASWAIRSHVVRSFWLRRRSVRPHKTLTWCRKAASARLLVGTAW